MPLFYLMAKSISFSGYLVDITELVRVWVLTNSGEKGAESDRLLEAPWRANREAKKPLKP